MEQLLDQFPVVELTTTLSSEQVRYLVDRCTHTKVSQDIFRVVVRDYRHLRLGEANRARKS